MSREERFEVCTLGRLLDGVESQVALERLSVLLKRPVSALEGLLTTPRRIAGDLPSTRAERLLRQLASCGMEAQARLEGGRALFLDSLVTVPPSHYRIDPARIAPKLIAPPYRERLQAEQADDLCELVSHSWWLSPTFALLLSVPTALLLQRYLLEVGVRNFQLGWATSMGIVLLLLAMALLPPLLSPRRLLSLHRPGEAQAELTLVQSSSLHPLRRDYRLHHPGGSGQVRSARYEVGKVAYFEHGSQQLYIDLDPPDEEDELDNDQLLERVGDRLLDEIIGMLRFKPVKGGWRRRNSGSGRALLFVVRDADGTLLARLRRDDDGGLGLQLEPMPQAQRGLVLMLALIGLGAA